jgi:hypothetical protein
MTVELQIYWDSCCWIGLINQEERWFGYLQSIFESAQRGDAQPWISTITILEVVKVLATALFYSVDEFHTDDGEDLLNLDKTLTCRDGRLLRICKPQDSSLSAQGRLQLQLKTCLMAFY